MSRNQTEVLKVLEVEGTYWLMKFECRKRMQPCPKPGVAVRKYPLDLCGLFTHSRLDDLVVEMTDALTERLPHFIR